MYLSGGENILRRDQLFKVAGYQASSKEKQVQVDKMKALCFLLRSYQKRYSLLLNKVRDVYNVVRDEYPVTTTLALDLLIYTEGGIKGHPKLSTYKNCGLEEESSTKSA